MDARHEAALDHPQGAPEDEQALVESFVREFIAYLQELRLYPENHPRLERRVDAVHQLLESHLATTGEPLVLQVRGEGVACSGRELAPSSVQVRHMARMLRERMIQRLRILPGIPADEVRGLVGLLRSKETLSADGNEELHPSPHIEIVPFPPEAAGDGSEDGSEADADVESWTGTESLDRVASEEEFVSALRRLPSWEGFSKERLLQISRVLRANRVTGRMTQVREVLANEEPGEEFLSRFFRVLQHDAELDWSDQDQLQDAVLGALDLILDVKAKGIDNLKVGNSGTILGTGFIDRLGSHLRWQVVRSFFPGSVEHSYPRDAEDLSFYDQVGAEENWVLKEQPAADWGLTPPEVAGKLVREHLVGGSVAQAYTQVVTELVGMSHDGRHDGFRDSFIDCLKRQVDESEEDASVILSSVWEGLRYSSLSPEMRMAWLCEVLRTVARPSQVLELIADGDEAALGSLLDHPPLPRPQEEQSRAVLAEPHQLLARIMGPRDAYALDVALEALTGPHDDRARAGGWLDYFADIAQHSAALTAWISRNVERLLQPDCLPLLLEIPTAKLWQILRNHFIAVGEHHMAGLFRQLAGSESPASTLLLTQGLECGSWTARHAAIDALARQHSKEGLAALRNLLWRNNEIGGDRREVQGACESLADWAGRPGREILEQIRTQRKGYFHAWRRRIRREARRALHTLGSRRST